MYKTLLGFFILTALSTPIFAQQHLALKLETYLGQLGLNPGKVDGVLDLATQTAISSYQSARGLPVTGWMNLEGFQALEREVLLGQSSAANLAKPTPQNAQTSGCRYEKAFGKIKSGTEIRLGDFCVNRATGSIDGPLSLSGLVLTKDDGVNFTFEDLNGGSTNQMQIAPVLTATYHSSTKVDDQSPEINVLSGREFFTGFIYNQLASPAQLAPAFRAHVGGEIFVEGGSSLGFSGEARFSDGMATIDVTDNPQYGTSKGTAGSISLSISENGQITGSGQIQTTNTRTAGYSANEWRSMTIKVDDLRGFATGPTGQVIKSYALVSAVVNDAEGDVRNAQGVLEVFLYDPQIWE